MIDYWSIIKKICYNNIQIRFGTEFSVTLKIDIFKTRFTTKGLLN